MLGTRAWSVTVQSQTRALLKEISSHSVARTPSDDGGNQRGQKYTPLILASGDDRWQHPCFTAFNSGPNVHIWPICVQVKGCMTVHLCVCVHVCTGFCFLIRLQPALWIDPSMGFINKERIFVGFIMLYLCWLDFRLLFSHWLSVNDSWVKFAQMACLTKPCQSTLQYAISRNVKKCYGVDIQQPVVWLPFFWGGGLGSRSSQAWTSKNSRVLTALLHHATHSRSKFLSQNRGRSLWHVLD